MKYLKIIAFLLFTLIACKKENTLPTLSFSAEESKWFIYQIGQSIKLKNALGDSVTYTVSSIRKDFKQEYKDPFTNQVEIGTAEFYQVNPISQTLYPWTKWKGAIYDQNFGFIELIDINGVSWLRQ